MDEREEVILLREHNASLKEKYASLEAKYASLEAKNEILNDTQLKLTTHLGKQTFWSSTVRDTYINRQF